jgi:hypothetical protein
MQGRPVIDILGVDIGPMPDQEFGEVSMTILRSPMQGRPSKLVAGVDFLAPAQQGTHPCQVAIFGGFVDVHRSSHVTLTSSPWVQIVKPWPGGGVPSDQIDLVDLVDLSKDTPRISSSWTLTHPRFF